MSQAPRWFLKDALPLTRLWTTDPSFPLSLCPPDTYAKNAQKNQPPKGLAQHFNVNSNGYSALVTQLPPGGTDRIRWQLALLWLPGRDHHSDCFLWSCPVCTCPGPLSVSNCAQKGSHKISTHHVAQNHFLPASVGFSLSSFSNCFFFFQSSQDTFFFFLHLIFTKPLWHRYCYYPHVVPGRQRRSETVCPAPGHCACERRSWDVNPVSLAPESKLPLHQTQTLCSRWSQAKQRMSSKEKLLSNNASGSQIWQKSWIRHSDHWCLKYTCLHVSEGSLPAHLLDLQPPRTPVTQATLWVQRTDG